MWNILKNAAKAAWNTVKQCFVRGFQAAVQEPAATIISVAADFSASAPIVSTVGAVLAGLQICLDVLAAPVRFTLAFVGFSHESSVSLGSYWSYWAALAMPSMGGVGGLVILGMKTIALLIIGLGAFSALLSTIALVIAVVPFFYEGYKEGVAARKATTEEKKTEEELEAVLVEALASIDLDVLKNLHV